MGEFNSWYLKDNIASEGKFSIYAGIMIKYLYTCLSSSFITKQFSVSQPSLWKAVLKV